jgi:hypothetical protein
MTARKLIREHTWIPDRLIKCRYELAEPGPDGRMKSFGWRWKFQADPQWPWIYKSGCFKQFPEWKDLLYNLDEVRAAIKAGEPIWFPEGEHDADTLILAGKVATAHHGAGRFTPAQAEHLRGARRIILALDIDPDDAYGHNAGASNLIDRLEALTRVRVPERRIQVVRPRLGKDVTDHLDQGGNLALRAPGGLIELSKSNVESLWAKSAVSNPGWYFVSEGHELKGRVV